MKDIYNELELRADENKVSNGVKNTTAKSVKTDTDITVTCTCDSGYIFDGDIYYKFWKSPNNVRRLMIKNPENTECSITVLLSEGDFTYYSYIEGNTKLKPVTITVNSELNNCIDNGTIPDTINTGETLNITLKAVTGYQFDTVPYLTTDVTEQQNFTVSDDKKTATLSFVVPNNATTITISGTADYVENPTDITIENNITGYRYDDLQLSHSYDGINAIITVTTPNENIRLENIQVSYTNTTGEQVTKNMYIAEFENYVEATITINDVDAHFTVTLTGVSHRGVPTTVYLNNCTPENPIPSFYFDFGTIEIKLTAKENTEFRDDGSSYLKAYYPSMYVKTVPFIISEDKKTATVTYTINENYCQGIVINGDCYPVQIVGEKYGSINVYKVTLENLKSFAQVRFNSNYDLGSYVNKLKRIYADVPEYSDDVIRCGDYSTTIPVKQPEQDVLILDFGTVLVPEHNDDLTDYECDIQLFLPFKGFVSLSNEYVGKTIKLEYIINIITGSGVARLYYNDIVFQVEQIEPSQDVIYRTSENELQIIGNDDWNELLFYGTEPYLYIKWYVSENQSVRNTDYVKGVISDFRGFIKVIDSDIITTPEMLIKEQEMIINELANGVYIE